MDDWIMKVQLHKIAAISLCLGLGSQITHSAVIKDTNKTITSNVMVERQSPIEKALNQQKQQKLGNPKLITETDQLKVLTSLKSAPTQNFFAEQHQRFSRFVQAIFQPHSS